MHATLVTNILKDALNKYNAPKIFNSDQGSQYTNHYHIQRLKDNNIQISMNGKGRSIYNIVIKRFFRTIKYKCIFMNDFKNITELKIGIDHYLYRYNDQRFYSGIGYKKTMDVYLNYTQNYYQLAA